MSDTGDNSLPGSSSASGGSASPGKLLAAGRASRELTIDEVGDALNLAPQTVEWLESDTFESLPAPAFTQGYMRNYAKLVGLDADAVVAAYHDAAGKPDVAWESPRRTAGLSDLVAKHPGVLISAVVAAVGLLILVVLLVVWPDDSSSDVEEVGVAPLDAALQNGGRVAGTAQAGQAPKPASAEASSRGPAAERLRVSAGNAGETSAVGEPSARFDTPGSRAAIDRDAIDPDDPLAHLPVATTYPAPAPSSTPASGPVTGSTTESVPVAASLQPVAGGTGAGDYALSVSGRLTSTGNDEIRFEVVEDCWIAIKTIDNEELYGRLGRAGQSIVLTGQAPFRLLLGYAPGAQVYLNDRQIRLDRYTRNNVASLVIGQ